MRHVSCQADEAQSMYTNFSSMIERGYAILSPLYSHSALLQEKLLHCNTVYRFWAVDSYGGQLLQTESQCVTCWFMEVGSLGLGSGRRRRGACGGLPMCRGGGRWRRALRPAARARRRGASHRCWRFCRLYRRR